MFILTLWITTSDDFENLLSHLFQTMLEYELFHKALFTLCAEIVLFSYNSQSR